MKVKIFILFFFAGLINASGQQVIAPSGGSAAMPGLRVEWTLGEPVSGTVSNGKNILTQGMHQTRLTVTGMNEIKVMWPKIRVYPNPAESLLKIEIRNANEVHLSFRLTNITGQELLSGALTREPGEIDMQTYVTGTYILTIYDKSGNQMRSWKVVKK